MTKLKLGPIIEDKPVKATVELPGPLHRDLVAYAEVLARESGQSPTVALRAALYLRVSTSRQTELPARVVIGPTLLTGICYCGNCGGAMTIRTGKSGRYRYYACSIKQPWI